MATTYQHIAENTRKTWLLMLLFPVTFVALTWGVFLCVAAFASSDAATSQELIQSGSHFLGIGSLTVWGIALLWIIISYFVGDKWLLSGAGAVHLSEKNFPEIYRLVENLCISRGLPVPRVFLINDDSLNAFATGRDPEHASVVLTTGIVKKLNRAELEGVIAHELSHVENRDIRLMLICVAGISFFTFVGEVIIRSALRSRGRSKDDGMVRLLFLLIGLLFLLYGCIFAPLIRLAVSRRREYQADASAALMTRNPAALASALRKISSDSRVEVLDKHESMAAMCIANPLGKKGIFSWLAGLTATHPPVEKRIAALEEMDRGF